MAHVLLLNPPCPTVPEDSRDVPLGLASIAAVLLEAGHAVSVLDLGVENESEARESLLRELAARRPDIVGTTSVTSTFQAATDLLSHSKRAEPGVLTVHGGVHVSFAHTHLNPGAADLIVVGEGELPMLEIAERCDDSGCYEGIDGVALRRQDAYTLERLGSRIADIDTLPLPARELFRSAAGDVMRVLTARGCPYSCAFCSSSSFWGQFPRYHSAERVLQEVESVMLEFGVTRILLVDDTFTADRAKALEILRLLTPLHAELACLSRATDLDEEMTVAMALSGMHTVSIGCESGSEESLRAARKGITRKDIVRAIENCRRADLKTRTSWLWGAPWDTLASLEQTIELISLSSPDEVVLYRFVPYIGTTVYEEHAAELSGISTNLFRSGTDRFLLGTGSMTVEQMEAAFQDALESLNELGYGRPGDEAGSAKTATSEFTVFSTFWPESDAS